MDDKAAVASTTSMLEETNVKEVSYPNIRDNIEGPDNSNKVVAHCQYCFNSSEIKCVQYIDSCKLSTSTKKHIHRKHVHLKLTCYNREKKVNVGPTLRKHVCREHVQDLYMCLNCDLNNISRHFFPHSSAQKTCKNSILL